VNPDKAVGSGTAAICIWLLKSPWNQYGKLLFLILQCLL